MTPCSGTAIPHREPSLHRAILAALSLVMKHGIGFLRGLSSKAHDLIELCEAGEAVVTSFQFVCSAHALGRCSGLDSAATVPRLRQRVDMRRRLIAARLAALLRFALLASGEPQKVVHAFLISSDEHYNVRAVSSRTAGLLKRSSIIRSATVHASTCSIRPEACQCSKAAQKLCSLTLSQQACRAARPARARALVDTLQRWPYSESERLHYANSRQHGHAASSR